MLLGITRNSKEKSRIALLKKLRLLLTVFFIAVFLPFATWLLYYFDVLKGTPIFSTEIQEPAAKVVTGTSTGTAFLISPTKLLTARHVLDNLTTGDKVDIIFEKAKEPRTEKGEIIFIAPTALTPNADGSVPMEYFLNDLAVIEVSAIQNITPLDLGESSVVTELDEVILIGYPDGDYSISKGNINSTSFKSFDLFKLDAASNPGNSGGPAILKEDNAVVGVLVGGSGPDYQGENIAMKIDDVKKILQSNKIDWSK